MSAMDQMLAGMLKSILPPEVLEMITPEKLQGFAQGINDYIDAQKAFQDEVLKRLTNLEEQSEYARGYGNRSGSDSGSDSGSS